jgi:hypothetical protein
MRVLGGQPRLMLAQELHALSQQRPAVLLLPHSVLEGRIEIPGQRDLRAGLDAKRRYELFEPPPTPVLHRMLLVEPSA